MKKEAVVVGILAATRIGATISNTLARNHHELSHKSLRTRRWFSRLADAEQRTAGIHSYEWAADHRILHHQWTDVNAGPIWKTYKLIQEAEQRGLSIPENFAGYDKKVDQFTTAEMITMGGLIEKHIEGNFGEDHWRPDFSTLSDEQVEASLKDGTPKYEYDRSWFNRKKKYSDEEAIFISLRDQHSPLLAPKNKDGSWNGVRFVLTKQLALSRVATQLLRQRWHLIPEDLRPENPDKLDSNHKMVIAGFGIYSLIALALLRDFSPKGLAKAAALGSLGNALGLGFLEKGGSAVNAFGHMGLASNINILRSVFSKNYDIDINPDGSIATDTVYAGMIGKVISVITGDESGQQAGHHLFPEAIAYPDSKGNVSWKNAPTGKVFEKMADSEVIKFIQRGDGLPANQFGRRDDEQNPVVDIIQAARVRTKYGKEIAKITNGEIRTIIPDEQTVQAVSMYLKEGCDFNTIGETLGIGWREAMLLAKAGVTMMVNHIQQKAT